MTTKPDPKRPWKAIAAAIIAGIGVAIGPMGVNLLPPVVVFLLTILAVALGTFMVPNPRISE